MKRPLYRRVAQLACREIGEETVVLHLGHRTAFGLNRAAGRLLRLVATPLSAASLARLLGRDDRRGKSQLETFLRELLGHGLIEHCSEGELAAGTEEAPDLSEIAELPRILWYEQLATVTYQGSPPQIITADPDCASQ